MKQRLILLAFCALLVASCSGGGTDATPTNTFTADEIQTIAIETFSAALTQTALAAPSETPFPTLTASTTFAPFTTSTGGTASVFQTIPSTASCYRLTFISDVTVPDNTAMTPGQTFTKTWKVQNTGSCAWDAGFKFAFVGGEQMNGATYTLPSSVAANALVDISVAMTAPSKTGTLRGNWRMQTAGGQFFGDEVYVQIVVGGSTGTATTGTATATSATSTSTLTPTVTVPPTVTPP
jgi:hypothetical protein